MSEEETIEQRAEAEDPGYALSASSYHEHERLRRQAERFAPFTCRLLERAAIGPGMRVLDVGCGPGDVSFLVAKLVGPDGGVVAIERDLGAVATARARATDARTANVEFIHGDFREVELDGGPVRRPRRTDGPDVSVRPNVSCERRHPGRDQRRRDLAGQGDPLRRHVGREPPEAHACHVPRLLDRLLYVLGASEPGGAGLGTIGLPPQKAERLARDAGFTRFCVHDFEDQPTSTTRFNPDGNGCAAATLEE